MSRTRDETAALIRRATSSSTESTATAVTTSSSSSNSFIGNTPSTVLFFIALAVGVCIALLFIYFTLRYFIKTKFGVYIPNHTFATRAGVPIGRMGPTGRYAFAGGVNTFNNFNDFADYALHRDYNALLAVRERRAQRRRYHKKRKLTKDEVDELFPTKTYFNWSNGGKEDDIERQKGLILHENEAEGINQDLEEEQTELSRQIEDKEHVIAAVESHKALEGATETDITEIAESSSRSVSHVKSEAAEKFDAEAKTTKSHTEEVDVTDAADVENDDLHFSSGTCAICLDTLDDDDIVRGLICGHVFHQDCIDPWLINRKACCPMCKRDYYMKDNNGEGGADGEDGPDDDSLMPLDSIADYILPRPIAYRARELLDALDAHESQGRPLNAETNVNNVSNENVEGQTSDSPIAETTLPHAPGHMDSGITIQDLVGIREAVAQRLPWYYNYFRRPFWRVMGITRQNLYDYLVVKIYEDRRRERFAAESVAAAQMRAADNGTIDEEHESIELAEGTNGRSNVPTSESPGPEVDTTVRRNNVENMV